MKEMIICKSCGYVMEKGHLKDRCPACGVPAKMFMPHDEKISQERKFLLSLDIHPVIVHFPQAFIGTILLLSLAGLVIKGPLLSFFEATIRTLGVFMPVVVAGAFLSGVFDAKTRFRKVKTPLLIRKMLLGSLLFLISCGIAAVSIYIPLNSPSLYLMVIGLTLPAVGCATLLGLIGTGLLTARFPG